MTDSVFGDIMFTAIILIFGVLGFQYLLKFIQGYGVSLYASGQKNNPINRGGIGVRYIKPASGFRRVLLLFVSVAYLLVAVGCVYLLIKDLQNLWRIKL